MEATVQMNDGTRIPVLAFGTAFIPNEEIAGPLSQALDLGFRHIDTAYCYENEQGVGEVLQRYFSEGKLKRAQVFVTTKLWATCLTKDEVRGAVAESLRRLQLDYVDLLLIHHPVAMKNAGPDVFFPRDKDGNVLLETNYDLVETWKELEQLKSEGKIASLGISNFNSEQVERICSSATARPVVNQVECHAYLAQKELQEFCKERGVLLEAYAPLGSPARPQRTQEGGEKDPVLLEEPVLKTIGDRHGKTPAQVLIRNLIQRGILVAVKSVTPSRIGENLQVSDFTLSAEDMASIDKLSEKNHRFFPFKILREHPEYPFKTPF